MPPTPDNVDVSTLKDGDLVMLRVNGVPTWIGPEKLEAFGTGLQIHHDPAWIERAKEMAAAQGMAWQLPTHWVRYVTGELGDRWDAVRLVEHVS